LWLKESVDGAHTCTRPPCPFSALPCRLASFGQHAVPAVPATCSGACVTTQQLQLRGTDGGSKPFNMMLRMQEIRCSKPQLQSSHNGGFWYHNAGCCPPPWQSGELLPSDMTAQAVQRPEREALHLCKALSSTCGAPAWPALAASCRSSKPTQLSLSILKRLSTHTLPSHSHLRDPPSRTVHAPTQFPDRPP
jgi:hypothetical protein